MKLTTHLHLVPGSKNVRSCTSTPPIRLHGVALSYSTGTTLPLQFIFRLNPLVFFFLNSVGLLHYYIRLLREEISILLSASLSHYSFAQSMSHFHKWLFVHTRKCHFGCNSNLAFRFMACLSHVHLIKSCNLPINIFFCPLC